MVDADRVLRDLGESKLIDIRTPREFAYGHIPGSVNVPYSQDFGISEEATRRQPQVFEEAGLGRDVPLVIYCHCGPRAQATANALRAAGWTDVEVYLGGWEDWTRDPSRPVER